MKVRITKADLKKAGHFNDVYGCLLCTALKRLGYDRVVAGIISARIGDDDFFIIKDGSRLLEQAYKADLLTVKKSAKPFTVTLKPA